VAYYIASTRIGRVQPEGRSTRIVESAIMVPAGLWHAVAADGSQAATACGLDLVRAGLHAFPHVEFTGEGPHRWCDDCRFKAIAYPDIEDPESA
jgi:hypothetical protein